LKLFLFLIASVGMFALMDRLLMAAFQRRSGPYILGWFGLLQPIVDGIKLIKKELTYIQQVNAII
jgi:NADH:ubiquinone oxidoreductase subunit H